MVWKVSYRFMSVDNVKSFAYSAVIITGGLYLSWDLSDHTYGLFLLWIKIFICGFRFGFQRDHFRIRSSETFQRILCSFHFCSIQRKTGRLFFKSFEKYYCKTIQITVFAGDEILFQNDCFLINRNDFLSLILSAAVKKYFI